MNIFAQRAADAPEVPHSFELPTQRNYPEHQYVCRRAAESHLDGNERIVRRHSEFAAEGTFRTESNQTRATHTPDQGVRVHKDSIIK